MLPATPFWPMHALRSGLPQTSPLARCEFATIRERLMKIGPRVIEHIARIRIPLPASLSRAGAVREIALGLWPAGP